MVAPKVCVDCQREGITTKRKLATDRNGKLVPGPRCATHWSARRARTKDSSWEKRLLETYGITADEYWKIYEAQGGRCYICRRGNGATKRLSVDHDHKTGIVRGLLDTSCNKWVLGMLRDDVEAAERVVAYLKNPPALAVIGERVVPTT